MRVGLLDPDKIDVYFVAQTRLKVSQLKTMLQNIKKWSLSMNEYLSKVKNTTDRLASLGYATSDSDHVEAISMIYQKIMILFIVSVNSISDVDKVEEFSLFS